MQLFLLGLNHKTAPVEVREQLALSPAQLPHALEGLREVGGVREAAILSTCNRAEIEIGRGALSVGSAAVELARQIFGPLTGHTVLILGAGDMAALTAHHLVASGAQRVLVSSRTHERARRLATQFTEADHTEAVAWDEFPQRLAEADIVIAGT